MNMVMALGDFFFGVSWFDLLGGLNLITPWDEYLYMCGRGGLSLGRTMAGSVLKRRVSLSCSK